MVAQDKDPDMATTTLDLPRFVGRLVFGVLRHVGRFSLMLAEIFRGFREWRIWLPRTIEESASVGLGSLFIVLLISAFAGAVTAFQAGYQWQTNLPLYVLGTLITETIVLELGPVLIGLVLAGRIGARNAAELGTMRVTEQIDALESLGRSPASHLIIPRVLAATFMVPVLVVVADVVAVGVGWLGVKQVLPVTDWDFAYGARYYWRPFDGYYSIIKAVAFGGAIGLISCYMGFNTQQGALGVGKSTTAAVVSSSVVILLLNVILAKLLLNQ
jgi:phospholipid/cholesterol/gamma-HCH transport system permease protein